MRHTITRLAAALTLAAATLLGSAPTATAETRWGVQAGANLTDLKFKQDLVGVSQGVGGRAGIQGEMMFPGIGFGLGMGLFYDQYGAKVDLGQKLAWSSQGYGDERATLHCVHIPLHLRFKWTRLNGLEDIVAPLVFGGPDFNIQVAHGGCKAFKYSGGDLSLTAGLGVELFTRWQVTASYTWGMTYALRTILLDNFSARARTWNVSLTYFFK